jgi:hypothetical protein
MDNKLIELSSPVAWAFKEHIWATGLCGYVWRDKLDDEAPDDECESVKDVSPLYSQEYVSALLAELEAKDKRIAEIEVSHKKLRETLAAVHNTITGSGAYTSLAGILTAVKRAYLESSDASASTVTVEGDE